MKPEIHVLGGPNGAGKTSTALLLLPRYLRVDQFVNADLIAADLDPDDPKRSVFQAGRLMLARIHELRERRTSFAFETTLATRSYVRFLRDAATFGYAIHIFYVWLQSVDLALSRIAARVHEGGHDVPEAVVRRRYMRGRQNLLNLYRPIADAWTICDNSGAGLEIVAQGRRGEKEKVLVPRLYARITEGDMNV